MQKKKNRFKFASSHWYWTIRDEGFKTSIFNHCIIKICKPVAIFNVVDLSATIYKFHDLNYSKESLQTKHNTGKS